MSNDIVRLAKQLVFSEAADVDEILVDVGDLALQIGFETIR
jgi:hypothetical protein